jgi:hypothetical protein
MKIGDLVVRLTMARGLKCPWVSDRLPVLGVVIAEREPDKMITAKSAVFRVAWTSGAVNEMEASWVKPYADEYDTLIK